MIERHPNIVFPFTIAYILAVFGIGIWWATSSLTPVPIIFLTIAASLIILAVAYDQVAEPYSEKKEKEEAAWYAATAASTPDPDYLAALRHKARTGELPRRTPPPHQ